MFIRLPFVLLCVFTAMEARGSDVDSDKDGLSDYQEIHKYFTDPKQGDSDGDGIQDSDWQERSEYTYTIRSVVKVMRPCNTSVINDDYQDAHVLSETNDYVELEVIHYPFNTNAEAIEGTRQWQNQPEELRVYLRPGITTNWDETMRRDLLAGLQKAGIQRERLTDKQVVEKVSEWLLSHGKYRYMFGTYFVHFPKGQAKVFPGLEDAFRREKGNTDLTFQQHLQHEVFGKGMFYNRSYGTCTSTATYLTTGLRAVGIPTRMILAIPLVDSSDPKQIQMIQEHISNHQVRRTLSRGLPPAGFSAHTFNEVYVGGRWRRLNYGKLGQNTYGQGAMGMLTHVHTFNDLSEAGLTKTWGWRYGRGEKDGTFRGSNPYRTTEISDRFGIHCKIENHPVEETKIVGITKAYWFFSDQRAKSIPSESMKKNHDGHILVHVDVSFNDLKTIYSKLGTEFLLTAQGKPTIRAQAERGYWNQECYIRIPADGFAKMVTGVPYQLTPTNQTSEYRWKVDEMVRITKN